MLLVAFVSMFAIIFNSWTGVKAVKEIWLRSAQSMGADDRRMFRHVILPGALPYILTGLRLGLAQAWRILVAVEMLAAVPWGLGWLIFGAREFLNTDAMMAGIVVIALIGLGLEKFVFQKHRKLHRGALGHDGDDAMTHDRQGQSRRSIVRAADHAGAAPPRSIKALARSGYFRAGAAADIAEHRSRRFTPCSPTAA